MTNVCQNDVLAGGTGGGDWAGGRVMDKRERHRTPKQ